MEFKAVIEQTKYLEMLDSLKGVVGKGKSTQYDVLIRQEIVQDLNNALILKLRVTNGDDFKELSYPIASGIVSVAPLVEFDKLHSIVKTLPVGVNFTMQETEQELHITYPRKRKPIVFNSVQSIMFPAFPVYDLTDAMKMSVEDLKKCLDLSKTYIDGKAQNPLLNCMEIKMENGLVTCFGLDSKYSRFFYGQFTSSHLSTGAITIEPTHLRSALKGLNTVFPVEVIDTPTHIIFNQPECQIATRKIAGSLPDITTRTHKQHAMNLTFSKEDILIALNRAKLFIDNTAQSQVVTVNFDSPQSLIESKSQLGHVSEEFDTNLNGQAFSMSFLVDSLSTAIESIDDETIEALINAKNCIILRPGVKSPTFDEQRILVSCLKQP